MEYRKVTVRDTVPEGNCFTEYLVFHPQTPNNFVACCMRAGGGGRMTPIHWLWQMWHCRALHQKLDDITGSVKLKKSSLFGVYR